VANDTIKDIISYTVKSLEPLELVQAGIPTGAKCGSIWIDDAFKKWLRTILKDKYKVLDPRDTKNKHRSFATEGPEMRAIMKVFDTYKRKFSKEARDVKLDLPEPLDTHNEKNHVIDGELVITA
jgi:hypothetical protein